MIAVIKCFFIVCFYFVKEKVFRIKPKEPEDKFVFVVTEEMEEDTECIIMIFSELEKAEEFCLNINAYKIRPYKLT